MNNQPQPHQPGTPADTTPAPADTSEVLRRYLVYGLSIPERAARSTVGLAAGAVQEAAQYLVPQAFQNSKTYELAVRNSLRFLTVDVGGVAAPAEEVVENQDYLARKTVGNFVDLAGLATLHVSPMWMLAIVSDVAYGTKNYVTELADELKAQGVIDESSTIHHVDDILEAIQGASGHAASLFDTPPLSVKDLQETLESTRESLTSADYSQILPEAEVKAYWEEMRQIAQKEDVSLLGVSAALTMETLGKVNTVSQGTFAGLKVAGGLFNRHIVEHYSNSLAHIKERGFYETVRESSAPYIAAVWTNFSSGRATWTEEVVSGRAIGKAVQTVSGWFRRSPSESQTALPDSENPNPQSDHPTAK